MKQLRFSRTITVDFGLSLQFHWEVPGFKRGPGRPWTSWRSTVNKDLLRMGITWVEAEVAALNRSEWRRSVAQCIHLHVGWIKVKVKDFSFLVSYFVSDFYCVIFKRLG